jgi:hypothetical protein
VPSFVKLKSVIAETFWHKKIKYLCEKENIKEIIIDYTGMRCIIVNCKLSAQIFETKRRNKKKSYIGKKTIVALINFVTEANAKNAITITH